MLDSTDSGSGLFPLLEAVARETGLTTILAAENNIYAQYVHVHVHVLMGGGALQFTVQPGTRRVLCMSGLGWAMLATRPDDDIARLVQRTQARLARGGQPVDAAEVLLRVRQTRAQGYAFSRGTVTEGVGIVGVALPPGASGERLAIGVGGPVASLERALPRLVGCLQARVATL